MSVSSNESERREPTTVSMSYEILDRMERAVERVRERLLRVTDSLKESRIEFAVVGDHAVASWVATVDEGAVRNAPDIELLVRHNDMTAIEGLFNKLGFVPHASKRGVAFLDGPQGNPRDAVFLFFAGLPFATGESRPAPEIDVVEDNQGLQVLKLLPLVESELIWNRNKNKVLIRDLIHVGLIDHTWPAKFPSELAARLQHVLDTPDG